MFEKKALPICYARAWSLPPPGGYNVMNMYVCICRGVHWFSDLVGSTDRNIYSQNTRY
jgi:hypothetical protein